jgi:hypothetical protein
VVQFGVGQQGRQLREDPREDALDVRRQFADRSEFHDEHVLHLTMRISFPVPEFHKP